MSLLRDIPNELVTFVTQGLVPLFILFNIVGWIGLPGREARRTDPPLSDQDLSNLGRAIRGAWFVGLHVALVALCVVVKMFPWSLDSKNLRPFGLNGLVWTGALGTVAGVMRGLWPALGHSRIRTPRARRRTLSVLVICAVAVSVVCAALYYDSHMLRSVIASAYMGMMIGYAGANVLGANK
jgi:hypothetical protein